MSKKADDDHPDRRILVRFRGRRAQVTYCPYKHEEYGYLWNFVAREFDDVFLTDAQHRSVTRQIRVHAERAGPPD
jgi:hypothetical protein